MERWGYGDTTLQLWSKGATIVGRLIRLWCYEEWPNFADLETPSFESYADDHDGEHSQVPDIDDVDPDTYDAYVGTEVGLLIGDKVMASKVKWWKRESDGTLKGMAHSNPILDTRTYEVEFPDGRIAKYSANIIAENMYA